MKVINHEQYHKLKLPKDQEEKLAHEVANDIEAYIENPNHTLEGLEEMLLLVIRSQSDPKNYDGTPTGYILGFMNEGRWDKYLIKDKDKRFTDNGEKQQ